MKYTVEDGTVINSNPQEVVTYICISEMSDGVYESYESGVDEDEIYKVIKILRTVLSGIVTTQVSELSNQEIEEYNLSLIPVEEPVIWDKSQYEKEVNILQEQWFLSIITPKPYNYKNEAELSLWKDDIEYGEEARQFIELWKSSYRVITEHLETVTEETADTNFIILKLNELWQ